mmetsp:Transcript_10635/g.15563  ORF Transcript_10635/g.15563 Transcript_10635/m.15563 type:complete len:466 (+) Transcript_10635:193-1590(+)
MSQLSKTRLEVATQIAGLVELDSPITAVAGIPPPPSLTSPKKKGNGSSENVQETSYSDALAPQDNSEIFGDEGTYVFAHSSMNKRSKLYTDKYQQFVINYVENWEQVISSRVTTGLKQAETLRLDLEHYSRKVESMRANATAMMSKGKIVGAKAADTLKRNEQKWINAQASHEAFKSSMLMLLDEVTERAWKDLHPLLLKMLQFDTTYSADEVRIFSDLDKAISLTKQIGTEHDIDIKGRLDKLRNDLPEVLYTGEKDFTLGTQVSEGPYYDGAIEGPASWASPPSDFTPGTSYIPPTGDTGTSSTMAMLHVAAASAPPPTMDMVNQATNTSQWQQQSRTQWQNQSYDYNSDPVSMNPSPSMTTVPAPAAAPPPPPESSPQFGMYHAAQVHANPSYPRAPSRTSSSNGVPPPSTSNPFNGGQSQRSFQQQRSLPPDFAPQSTYESNGGIPVHQTSVPSKNPFDTF